MMLPVEVVAELQHVPGVDADQSMFSHISLLIPMINPASSTVSSSRNRA